MRYRMIRVKAYKTISDVYFDSILWDDLSISANGELSIYPMRRYWDLQKIAVSRLQYDLYTWSEDSAGCRFSTCHVLLAK